MRRAYHRSSNQLGLFDLTHLRVHVVLVFSVTQEILEWSEEIYQRSNNGRQLPCYYVSLLCFPVSHWLLDPGAESQEKQGHQHPALLNSELRPAATHLFFSLVRVASFSSSAPRTQGHHRSQCPPRLPHAHQRRPPARPVSCRLPLGR